MFLGKCICNAVFRSYFIQTCVNSFISSPSTVEVLDTNYFAIRTDTNFNASSDIQDQSQSFADAAREMFC